MRLDEITKGLVIAREVKNGGAFIFVGSPHLPSLTISTVLYNTTESSGFSPLGQVQVLPGELCHNTASPGPSSSLHKAKHSVSRLAASALAPGPHLLPVLLRVPLPSRQPPPCPGKKREVISPAKCRGSGQMPLWRQAGVCHSNSRGQDLNQPPNLWRVGW